MRIILFAWYKNNQYMIGSKQDIVIDESITYSLATDTFSMPLRLTNKSSHIYVFKIKTNQRSVISMQVTHDFIKAESVKDIIIKLAEKPSETTPLRLELNYAVPSEEEIRTNDSKMNSYGRDNIFRRIITIARDDSAKPATTLNSSSHKEKNKDESVFADQISVNISAISTTSQKEEKKVEKKEEKQVQRKDEKRQEKREEKREQKEEKFEPYIATQTPVKYPDLSYIRQVQSEQISIVTGKSTQIDVASLVAEAPSSSEQAINAYKNPVSIGSQLAEAIKNESKPVINIPNDQSFILATASPTSKKSNSQEKRFKSEEERTLTELSEKLEKEQNTITRLKNEQISQLRSDCVYPIPIVYLLVLAAFFGGALLNWIIV